MRSLKLFLFLILFVSFPKACLGGALFWIDGKLPPQSETEGVWLWDSGLKQDNTACHTDAPGEGERGHSFITEKTVRLDSNSRIIQDVFLDPQDPPSGIMISFSTGMDKEDDITLYWEGEEEVFKDRYVTSWYMGFLPEKGLWTQLQIDCRELDIKDARINGASFITSNGRVWWGRTVIVND